MPSAVYYGCSMYRVFTPGEKLFLSEVEFDSLQAGDIIAIRKPGEKQYVHRVIEKTAQYAVTMGDNNPTADLLHVTAQDIFFLVVSAENNQGKVRKISGGAAGMKEFYAHRRRRWLRLLCRKILFKSEKLLFWRITVRESKQFGDEICYYWKSHAVGRKTADGRNAYASWRDFLRFRLPEDKI